MDLNSSIGLLKGVGEKTLNNLKDYNIETLKDLLFYLPKKYSVYLLEDVFSINEDKKVLVKGVISSFIVKKMHYNQEMIILYLNVSGKNIKCIFFGQGFLKYSIKKGLFVSICGTYNIENKEIVGTKLLTEDLNIYIDIDYKMDAMTNNAIKKAIFQIFSLEFELEDELPSYLTQKYRLLNFKDYIYKSHFPSSLNDIKQLIRRKKYNDFLKYTTSLKLLENNITNLPKKVRSFDNEIINKFIINLDYELTISQKETIETILHDVSSNHVMNRLVEGDVGSGKTIVAFITMLAEILSGYQVLLMAPTELLAKQHYEKFLQVFKKYNIETRLLTSSIKKQYVDEALNGLRDGRVKCLISTQAILYRKNIFDNLGLIVIDEQHRFGVEQRSQLLNNNPNVDALYLSATPIPRTLGLTHFGDLSLSKLTEKPNGRKKILTNVISFKDILKLKDKIKNVIDNGHQIFVVVSQIEDNGLDAYDIDSAYELFSNLIPDIKIGKLNGKLTENYKNKIMEDFKNHKYDILISTTVIEVGIDIKDATIMFILDADRFGLSTLHQLRGRVGRNSYESYCYLVSKYLNNDRLRALENTDDCFELSEIDLKLRGPGDILGTEQSGFINLDFENDYAIYKCALEDSIDLINNHSNSKFVENINRNLKEKNNKLN